MDQARSRRCLIERLRSAICARVAFRMRSHLLTLALVLLAGHASAANTLTKELPLLRNIGGNVWDVVHDGGNTVSTTRTWAKGTELGSAKATDVFTWVYRERSKIPLNVATPVSALAAARVAAKVVPLLGVASTAYEFWELARCKYENGSITCDPGVQANSPTGVKYCYNGANVEPCNTDPVALCKGMFPDATVIGPDSSGNYSCNPYFAMVKTTTTQQPCPTVNGQTVTPGPDGRCPTGQFQTQTEEDVAQKLLNLAPNVPRYVDRVPEIVREATDIGVPVPAQTPSVSGPSTVAQGTKTVTKTNPDGSTVTTNVTNNLKLTYEGSQITINNQTITENPDGTTTEETDPSFMDWLCGVAGLPDCNVKVNESGTPQKYEPNTSKLDEIKIAEAAKINEVAQTIPNPDLGWFDAPPIAACRKIVFPHDIGEADPCGVVDAVRSVMAYLWALVAAWVSFGWIRQAVNGG